HVCAPETLAPEIKKGDPRQFGRHLETLRARLAEQAHQTGLTELPDYHPDRLRVMVGSPPTEILALAGGVKAEVVVIGAVEGGVVHHELLGATACEVIRKAPCPVLLARSASVFPPERVEIPVDFSPISAHALRQGLDLLAGAGGVPPRTEVLFALSPIEVESSLQFTSEQLKRMAAKELDRFLALSPPSQVPLRQQVVVDHPRSAILSALEDRQVDLVILGTHGRGGFKRLVLGSIALEVARHARCNVLVVPPRHAPLRPAKEREREMQA
ncbi:MAG TPA: universal stress protein, partial [Thermoanaerobaculia bacterium]